MRQIVLVIITVVLLVGAVGANIDGNGSVKLYLPMNGTFADFSLSAHTVVNNGTAFNTTTPIAGNASGYLQNSSIQYLALDGSGDFAFGIQDFSIQIRFNQTVQGPVSLYLYDGRPESTNGNYPSIFIFTDETIRYFVNGGTRITGTVPVALNSSHTALLARINNITTLQVDGVQQGSPWVDTTNYVNTDPSRPMIGNYGFGPTENRTFNGLIDEIVVRVGDGVVSNSSIVPDTEFITNPAASFTQDKSNCTSPCTVTITNTSIGNVAESSQFLFIANDTSFGGNGTELYVGSNPVQAFTIGQGNWLIRKNIYNPFGISDALSFVNVTAGGAIQYNTTIKHNYINITPIPPTGYTQHDFLISQLYPVIVYIRDINTNALIPSAIVVDSNGLYLPSSGAGAFAYNYPYGLISFTANATGYSTLTSQFLITGSSTETMLLTPTGAPVPSQNTWWTPHIVQIVLMDSTYQNRLTGVVMNISFNQSAIPIDWLSQIYGIQGTPSAAMVNKYLYLNGTTGSDGTLTSTLLGSLMYDIRMSSVQYGLNNYMVQAYPADNMLNIYIPTANNLLPIQGNSSYAQLNGTRVYVTEPNISYVTMHIDYQDVSGLTQLLNETWQFANNGTVVQFLSIPNPGTSLIQNSYTVPNIRGVQYWWGYNATRAV